MYRLAPDVIERVMAMRGATATATTAPSPTRTVTQTPPLPTATLPTGSPAPRGTPRRVTATPAGPGRGPALAPGVDWPELADVNQLTPLASTVDFKVYAGDPQDDLLVGAARRWAPELQPILAGVSAKLDGRKLPKRPVHVVFTRAYAARCPARGLAAMAQDPPLLMIFLGERTSDVQLRAVLAHEIAHHLTVTDAFVGDGVLTEGIANWGADAAMLAWQGYRSWDAAVRDYMMRGDYISITDPTALNPRPGEACLVRRDRAYNIRTSFVDWLVRRIGLDAVLAMPAIEIEAPQPNRKDPVIIPVPDYPAATGHDLATLERMWLRDVRAGGWPEAARRPGRPRG